VSFEVGDGLEMLRTHRPFDVVLALHVLGFAGDPVGFLEVARECAKRIVVEVPDLDADPLNRVRLAECRPYYHDQEYVAEFSRDGVQSCLEVAGWRVTKIDSRDGAVIALADA